MLCLENSVIGMLNGMVCFCYYIMNVYRVLFFRMLWKCCEENMCVNKCCLKLVIKWNEKFWRLIFYYFILFVVELILLRYIGFVLFDDSL